MLRWFFGRLFRGRRDAIWRETVRPFAEEANRLQYRAWEADRRSRRILP